MQRILICEETEKMTPPIGDSYLEWWQQILLLLGFIIVMYVFWKLTPEAEREDFWSIP